VVALFDLDGTITRYDTLPVYLGGFLRRHPARLLCLPGALGAFGRFALGRADRGELKSSAIRAVLGGRTRAEVAAWTARFVPPLIERGLSRDALAAIARHRDAGDYLVMLSASPDLYVPDVARALGFAEAWSTGLEWNGGKLSGRLTTANRRGAEKARCLQRLRAQHPGLPIVAYGNAVSDLEHLALADRGLLVNGSPLARRRAARLRIACATWR